MVRSLVKVVEIALDPVHSGENVHLPCEGYFKVELPNEEDDFRDILIRKWICRRS